MSLYYELKRRNWSRAGITCLAAAWLLLVASYAEPSGAQSLADADAIETILEEVVVTARKRSESLQEVPLSMLAIDADAIRAADINKLEELQTYVPNLRVTLTGIGTNLSMRGIGSGENQGFEQSVGTYVDGVYRGRAQQSRMPFLDLEKIEVLRGPQSTLFGKNSIAGALNISTARPANTLEAELRLLYEPDFGESKLDGFISGPLSETLNGRLSVHWRDMDGYMDNITMNRKEAQREERTVRGILAWSPGESLEMTLKLETGTFDASGWDMEVVEDRPSVFGPFTGLTYAQIIRSFGGDASVANNFQDYCRSSEDEVSDNDTEEYVLSLNYSGWDDLTLTSITAYSAYEYGELRDIDITGANVFDAFFGEDYDQFSQELRLTSPSGGRFEWLGGLFYQSSDLVFFDTLLVNETSLMVPIIDAMAGPGVGQLMADTGTPRIFDQHTDTMALFGQATWRVSDRTHLTFGGRLSRDEKTGARKTTITDMEFNPLPPEIDLPTQGLYQTLINATNHDLKGSRDETRFMPSFSVQHDISDNAMAYLSYARGAKSGGYDARSNNAPENGGTFEFGDEQADALELGTKLSLAEGRAELNLALFYTEYDDLQVSTYDGVLGYNVSNAARAVSRGLEADGRWLATDRLLLSGAFAWTDFEFKKYRGQCWFGRAPDAPDGINCDYAGQTNLMTPEYSGTLSATWFDEFSNGMGLDATLDVLYTDDYLLTPTLDPRFVQDSHVRLNGRLALTLAGGEWEIALVGKNLSDEVIVNFGNYVPLAGPTFGALGFFAFIEQPRSLAMQVTWKH
jgi:outer membrane receptor protein involved in Fe transport